MSIFSDSRKRRRRDDDLCMASMIRRHAVVETVPEAPAGMEYNGQYLKRPMQIRLANLMAELLLKTGSAHLLGNTCTGKTMVVGTAQNIFQYRTNAELSFERKRKILFVNILMSGGSEARKVSELGASVLTNSFSMSNKTHVSRLERHLKTCNFASVIMTPRGFTLGCGGRHGKYKYSLSDFNQDEIRSGRVDVEHNPDVAEDAPKKVIPPLAELCMRNEVDDLVLFVDEVQQMMSQTNSTGTNIVLGLKALGEASWVHRKFDLRVVTASADPTEKTTTVSDTLHWKQMHQMYTLRDSTIEFLDASIKKMVLDARASSLVCMKEHEVVQIDELRSWQTGSTNVENRLGGKAPKMRMAMLKNAADNVSRTAISNLMVMTTLLHDLPADQLGNKVDAVDSEGNVHTVCIRLRLPKVVKRSTDTNIYITPRLALQHYYASHAASDAARFICGDFKSDHCNVAYNPKNPHKVFMRRVVQLTNDSERVACEVVSHYHFVLVVVPDNVNAMIADLDEVCENHENKSTVVFNLMCLDEDTLDARIQTDVRSEFEKNERMVMCLVNAKSTTGTNLFGDLATCTAAFGLDTAGNNQAFSRSARDTNPQIGKVYPMKQSYVFLLPSSNIISGIHQESKRNWKESMFDQMIKRANGAMTFYDNSVIKINDDCMQRLYKKFFFDYSLGKYGPIQFNDASANAGRSYNEPEAVSMVNNFVALLKERNNNSHAWEDKLYQYMQKYLDCVVVRRHDN